MSHANAEASFADGLVLYGEYNGTSDLMILALYSTREERNARWREEHREPACSCGGDEPVLLWTDYGGGMTWPGRACRTCRCVTAAPDPDE